MEACLASRPLNGGLVELSALLSAVRRRRGAAAAAVTEDDVLRAAAQLRQLGGGWDLLTCGSQRLLRSVPTELTDDGRTLLARAAEAGGVLTAQTACQLTGWAQRRTSDALEALLKDGLAMVDTGDADRTTRWWFPSLLKAAATAATQHAAAAPEAQAGPTGT